MLLIYHPKGFTFHAELLEQKKNRFDDILIY